MIAATLAHNNYPSIHLSDKVLLALQLMDDYDFQHLCVLSEDRFAGIISKNEIMDADTNATIATLQKNFIQVFVKSADHFLTALKLIAENELSLIPVINNNQQLVGIITIYEILKIMASFNGTQEQGGIIVLEIDKRNYSFGEISRLVETNDAYITQLNTMAEKDDIVIVTLKINKTEVSDIVSTFQRFDYTVRYYFGEEQYSNELKENYHHLMAYLNI